jgi:hypothetical protein
MKELLLQIAGVKTEAEFYKKFPSKEAFFKAYPEAQKIIAQYQQQEMMANAPENSEEQMMDTEEEMVEQMASGGNVPTNPELWSRAKAAAKAKYDVYPSAYANGFAAKWYKEKGGSWKKAAMGGYINEYAEGGGIDNPGFKALPKSVQDNIIANMSMGGEVDEYANGGGIPQRYKNMGFTKVGQKKQGDGKHKWKVLAKKGDSYKVVQGGWRGMEDFSQHKSQKRKDNFWSRMGGRDSAKANDPFSPLYWHKRFGTWANGGIIPEMEELMLAGDYYNMGGYVEYPTQYFLGGLLDGPQGAPQDSPQDFQNNSMSPMNYPGGGMIAGPMMGYEDDEFMYAMGGGININPANKGKFTEWAASRGMGVQEAANKVMANKDKYPTNIVQMANFARNAAKWKKQDGGDISALNTLYNKMPVQTESYQGQPEQVVLPDGTIESVNATQSHENMSDNQITDVLPTGSHIQSSRNKYTPAQYQQLIDMFTPEVAKERMEQIAQITKGKNKKISPAEISEYAKNKYQKQSTPNSFDTNKLKESNKKSFVDLSIQMNDLIKAGKELAEGQMYEEQMMAYGGYIPKAQDGVNNFGIPVSNKYTTPEDWSILEKYVTLNPKGKARISFPSNLSLEEKLKIEKAAENYDLTNLVQGYTPNTGGRFSSGLTGTDFEQKLALTTLGLEEYNKIKNNPSKIREVAYKTIGFNPSKKVNYNDPKFYNEFKSAFESALPENMRPFFGNTGPMGLDYWNAIAAKKATPATPVTPQTPQTPAQQAADLELARINAVAGARQMPMQNRFNYGLLEGQLGRGLSANEAYLNAAMDLNPLYIMETPDTYIRSRKNEIPIGNILYNIEKAQRNSANALAAQTGDWSTLASNIANAGASAMNQVGDTLSALNTQNVGLYNTTQGLQQGLLGENIDVRNQNLTNAQNMANLKRNLLGQKAVRDAELYSQYAKSMGENTQKEQNQRLELLNIMAAKPDMFRGEKGQRFANQIMGNYGSFNNPFAGSPLDFIFSNIGG